MIRTDGEITPMGDTGFVRDQKEGKGRMDLLPWYAILELSKHCEEGAMKYGEHNIDKGAPLHSLLDSGARHLAKVFLGQTDEDHLKAACWNLMWALQQTITHPTLNDLYKSEIWEDNEAEWWEAVEPLKTHLNEKLHCPICGEVIEEGEHRCSRCNQLLKLVKNS